MTMTLVKLSYNSILVPDPGLVLQTPLCTHTLNTIVEGDGIKSRLPFKMFSTLLATPVSLPIVYRLGHFKVRNMVK